MEILSLLVLSVPVFYILGIVQIISWFKKKDSTDKKVFEKIKSAAQKSPNKTLKEYYQDQKSHYQVTGDESEDNDALDSSAPVEEEIAKSVMAQDAGDFLSNWYSTNSINLLLYLGAFLIVAAASIFVGFQWDSLSGTVKAIVLTLLTLSFFGSGLWFRTISKIKTAGITFIGISALLIPICGTGWYNFVLKDMGVSAGAVWMVTSFVSLGLYAYLAYKFKNAFFTYTASLATISLALSFVNVAGLNKNVYILASLAGSFLLLLAGLYAKKEKPDDKYIGLPLEICANIVMPATLAYGLYAALLSNSLFTFEASAGVLIAALFYLVTYLTNKSIYALLASQFLLPAGLILLFEFIKIPHNYLLYALDFIAALYLYVALLLKKDLLKNESDTNLFSSVLLSIIVFILGYAFQISSGEQFLLALVPIATGAGAAFIRKSVQFAYISTIFTIVATWILTMQVFHLNTHPQYLAHIFTSFGVVIFAVGLQKGTNKDFGNFCKISTSLFFLASIIVANVNLTTQSITFAMGAVLLLALYIAEKKKEALYAMALFLNISLLFLLPSYKIKAQIEYYPLYFSALSIAFYVSSFFFKKESDVLKNIGIVNQLVTTAGSLVFSGQSHSFSYYRPRPTESMTYLSTGYILTVLTGLDYFVRRKANMDYLTSFFVLSTYIWHLWYLNISETLYYSLPIGLYFLVLGFLREERHNEHDNANILNLVGNGMLIIPTFFLAQSNSGWFYPVVLGGIGLSLLGIGISTKNRTYQFSGSAGIILAIIPQTFQYLLLIPKWLLVGIVGLVFVVAAIFLLLKRDENKR